MNVAVVQMSPVPKDKELNRAAMIRGVKAAASNGPHLVVFPECALTGYLMESAEEALSVGETVPGPSTEVFRDLCARTDTYIIFGLIEKDGKKLYNTAVLVGPEGVVGRHRKAHLVRVAVDSFVAPGQHLEVFEIRGIRIGLLICYEIRFPEASRVLALKGAQMIVVIANWPMGAEVNPNIMVPARAAENHVYVLGVNRSGKEGTLSFIGNSVIYDPNGSLLCKASKEETVLKADLDLQKGGLQKVNVPPSGYCVDLTGHRRPELYGILVET